MGVVAGAGLVPEGVALLGDVGPVLELLDKVRNLKVFG